MSFELKYGLWIIDYRYRSVLVLYQQIIYALRTRIWFYDS